MLFLHCVRRAASRAACTAGSNNEISTLMIAITTSNSISVKAARFFMMALSLSFRGDFLAGRALLVAHDVLDAVVGDEIAFGNALDLPVAIRAFARLVQTRHR